MRKPSELRFELRQFSSDQIHAMLEESANWRRMNIKHRDALLGDMRKGSWNCSNGETIAIDDSGRVVNGQHRLSAAAIHQRETGDTVWFWVAYGTTADAVVTMDQGKNRTLKELIESEGVANAHQCASIALTIVPVMEVGIRGVLDSRGNSTLAIQQNSWVSNKGAIMEWSPLPAKLAKAGLSRSMLITQVLYHAWVHSPQQARLFADQLASGLNLRDNDPVYRLRARFISDRNALTKMPREHAAALVVKAWNAWVRGEGMKLLRYHGSGPNCEEYPELVRAAEVAC